MQTVSSRLYARVGSLKARCKPSTMTPHTHHTHPPHTQIIVDRQARQLEGHMSSYTELLEKERSATQQNPLGSGATSPLTSTATTGGEGLCSSTAARVRDCVVALPLG